MEGESDASPEHGRCFTRSKEFLESDRNSRRSWIGVVDWKPRSRRRLEVCWREIIEATTLRPIEQSQQRARDVERPKLARGPNLAERIGSPASSDSVTSRQNVGPGGFVE